MVANIKQIQTSAGTHEIDAKYWDGHLFSEIEEFVHGVVNTYVIPAQTTNKTPDYTAIVESTDAQVTTTTSKLGVLTGVPDGDWDKFGVGDIVLMGASSDGAKNFDRWISAIDADGNIKLDVLETQVAAHHHTIDITTTSGKVLTGVSGNPSTVTLTSVGSAVTVLTSATGTFVTSVNYDNNGKNDLTLSSSSASGDVVSHSHTVNAHSHSFTPTSLVSQTASAYTTLTSVKHNIHSHTVVSAAGKWSEGTTFDVVTGVSASGTFIKNLKDSSSQTTGVNNAGLTTKENNTALSTSAQTASDTIGEVVKTKSAGVHEHTVTTTTTSDVVTGVVVAASVVTSVNFTKPTVAASVVTSSYLTVNASGVLSLSAPRVSQTSGSISVSRTAQSYTSGKVVATGIAASAGGHQHGFSHTHAIPSHIHTIDSHTHTYVKTVASETGNAVTSLSTSSYTPHTHAANISAASIATGSTEVNIVTGGDQTEVVRNLKNSSFSTGTSSPTTDTKYVALVGEIIFPGITAPTASVSTSSTSITPAVTGTQKAISGITFTSANFIKTVTSGTIKTKKNIGGNPI